MTKIRIMAILSALAVLTALIPEAALEVPENNEINIYVEAQSAAPLTVEAGAVYTGDCGENLTWELIADTGVLTISGTGKMTDWSTAKRVPWYPYKDSIITVVIGDGADNVGNNAFSLCESLENLTLGSGIRTIGTKAFYSCEKLKDAVIPDKAETINQSAFYLCRELASVTLGGGVKTIGQNAFEGCSSLVSVTIPASVTAIGEGVFSHCTSLKQISVDGGNANYCSDEYGVLFTKDMTLLVQYPAGNTRTSYTMPDGVRETNDAAFANSSLVSVKIPDGFTTIGSYTFGYYEALTDIILPDSVETIEERAFIYCCALTGITIPRGVTEIGEAAFMDCCVLTGIKVDSANSCYRSDEYGVLFNKAMSLIIQYPIGNERTSYTIPDCVTEIGNEAFEDSGLVDIVIPDSVTSIGKFAFCFSSELVRLCMGGVRIIGDMAFSYCDALKSARLTGSLETISHSAFYGCDGLRVVEIGSRVTNIEKCAFYGCENLQGVYFYGDSPTSFGVEVFGEASDDFTIYYTDGANGWTSPIWNEYDTATFMPDNSNFKPTDLIKLRFYILNKREYTPVWDINRDGEINGADVDALRTSIIFNATMNIRLSH